VLRSQVRESAISAKKFGPITKTGYLGWPRKWKLGNGASDTTKAAEIIRKPSKTPRKHNPGKWDTRENTPHVSSRYFGPAYSIGEIFLFLQVGGLSSKTFHLPESNSLDFH